MCDFFQEKTRKNGNLILSNSSGVRRKERYDLNRGRGGGAAIKCNSLIWVHPFDYALRRLSKLLGRLRIDDFRTTAPLGHLIVSRRRPVEI